jgi:hypothetical protein
MDDERRPLSEAFCAAAVTLNDVGAPKNEAASESVALDGRSPDASTVAVAWRNIPPLTLSTAAACPADGNAVASKAAVVNVLKCFIARSPRQKWRFRRDLDEAISETME